MTKSSAVKISGRAFQSRGALPEISKAQHTVDGNVRVQTLKSDYLSIKASLFRRKTKYFKMYTAHQHQCNSRYDCVL